jgi:glucose-1-phosphate cytidylyltransferase
MKSLVNDLKAIILAGGLGTRLSEETSDKPKPMVKIGDLTLIEHIMNTYAFYGVNDFVIATGYLHEVVDQYFKDYTKYKVQCLFTGNDTQTGGRIKRAIESTDDDLICVTYGDGLANVNINKLINFHKSSKNLATVTAVRPPARFGRLKIIGDKVVNFGEKMQSEEGWINGGYFVLDKKVTNYISGDEMPFEWDPLTKLTQERTLGAFFHEGFWAPVDTLREKKELEKFWNDSNPPWVMK